MVCTFPHLHRLHLSGNYRVGRQTLPTSPPLRMLSMNGGLTGTRGTTPP
jgi:hypothetical protein